MRQCLTTWRWQAHSQHCTCIIVSRLQQSTKHSAWSAWKAALQSQSEKRALLHRCIGLLRGVKLQKVWVAWKERSDRSGEQKRRAARCIQRMQSRSLSSAWGAWKDRHEAHLWRKGLVESAMGSFHEKRAANVLFAWRQACKDSQEKRRKLCSTVMALSRSSAHRAFGAWKGRVTSKSKRQHLLQVGPCAML